MNKTTTMMMLWAASCAQQPPVGTPVAANSLGVTALQIERGGDATGTRFEVRGTAADESTVARVSLRIGAIADLPALLPGDDAEGSEILLATDGEPMRIVSREVQQFHVESTDPRMEAFLQLPEVAAALATANIDVARPAAAGDEQALMTYVCQSGFMLTSPLASQCCYSDMNGYSGTYSRPNVFIRTADNSAITRYRNPVGPGNGCKASDGTSACAGSACFFGPNGFSRASIASGGSYYPKVYPDPVGSTATCRYAFYSTFQPHVFSDVTGTNAPGQGCPGGSMAKGAWDY